MAELVPAIEVFLDRLLQGRRVMPAAKAGMTP
jgi:hypothetical protein